MQSYLAALCGVCGEKFVWMRVEHLSFDWARSYPPGHALQAACSAAVPFFLSIIAGLSRKHWVSHQSSSSYDCLLGVPRSICCCPPMHCAAGSPGTLLPSNLAGSHLLFA